MIVADQLTKRFNDFTAVAELSLAVQPGQLLALLGPNGAGKTTTVRMLSAILKPSAGSAAVNGYDVVAQAGQVRRSVGLLTEQPGLYTRSSGLEYLQFFARLYGLDDDTSRRRALELFERFAMPNTAHRRLGEYSKGMRQKVGLIRAMLHDPAVLLLDEPTSAMDPLSAKLVRDAVLEMRDHRRAIIVCTHNLAEAELLADRIAIISYGRIIAQGTPPELKRQLLGQARFEVQLDRPINGQLTELDQLVTVEYQGQSSLRFRTDDPHGTNPLVVRHLTAAGLGVVTLREMSISLEQVYLSVVDGEQTWEH
ncbi:MAG: ABC transporter ATP-binding protein [Candidatus Promineifilaceae bacterium]|nr:ABC transporter ATP-binding protein [Candidatus Promineifilaceae bacterium]